MADRMNFPPTFEEFINDYSFKDKEEIYTNGTELIPVFRVMQAWDHYTEDIKQNLNNIYDFLKIVKNDLYDIEEEYSRAINKLVIVR